MATAASALRLASYPLQKLPALRLSIARDGPAGCPGAARLTAGRWLPAEKQPIPSLEHRICASGPANPAGSVGDNRGCSRSAVSNRARGALGRRAAELAAAYLRGSSQHLRRQADAGSRRFELVAPGFGSPARIAVRRGAVFGS